jgi:hypothetical protein
MAKANDPIRDQAESDIVSFLRLVAPHRVLGKIHEELLRWITRSEAKSHQLVLLPRDHQKSAMAAYWVAWQIVKNPAITVLYISSTSNLAEKQLKAIKDVLTSKPVRRYWPDLVNEEEGKREKWTGSEIAVDHPKRKAEGVRDPTVFTAGLTSSITGMHCDIAVLDDTVVIENAYSREGRNKVRETYSLLASVESSDAKELVVGTRYHPADLYGDLLEMVEEQLDSSGDVTSSKNVYEVFQREVEDKGDGTGEYLWPRTQRHDGRWFGFNQEVLAKKRAQYLDKTQFFAQYYNNPNDSSNEAIKGEYFQYYDRKYLEKRGGKWFFKDRMLSVQAAIDFAYSTSKTADYTSLVVIGSDNDRNIYVLDIQRFKTAKIVEYFEKILKSYDRWEFPRLRAEASVAQAAIIEELKTNHIRRAGIMLSIESYHPTRHSGAKEERIDSILRPRYEGRTVWHYHGGACEELEQELRMKHPKHDDVKDALAMAVDAVYAPRTGYSDRIRQRSRLEAHSRFGGIS